MLYSRYMGIVRNIGRQIDHNSGIAERSYMVADVELDNGNRVQVSPEGLGKGDRVEVQYQGFRYAVTERLAF